MIFSLLKLFSLIVLFAYPCIAQTVYVTDTGTKYHLSTCRYVNISSNSMGIEKAAEKYEPCGVCKPPKYKKTGKTNTEPQKERTTAPKKTSTTTTKSKSTVSSSRCQAITKKGTQCKRNAQSGRNFCWQH